MYIRNVCWRFLANLPLISLRHASRGSERRYRGARERLSVFEKDNYRLSQRIDMREVVVSGDMIMHLLPQAFDGVVVRRIGRQKVKHDAPRQEGEIAIYDLRFVSDIVVRYHMQPSGSAISAVQVLHEFEERPRRLVGDEPGNNATSADIERLEHVAFDVLAGVSTTGC